MTSAHPTLDPAPSRTAAAPAPRRHRDAAAWLRANLVVIGIGMLTAALYLWALDHVGWPISPLAAPGGGGSSGGTRYELSTTA